MNAEEIEAKNALDELIRKSRVHLYKPIQIAEILFRDRTYNDIDLLKLETYRNKSKGWRDEVCLKLVGRTSTSSARFQDNLFEQNAIPPETLKTLSQINKRNQGVVEKYIYNKFSSKISQLHNGLDYCLSSDPRTFNLQNFLELFWHEPGLRRSIDKIYEIVVYALFSTLVEELKISVEVSLQNNESQLLKEFEDFTQKVIQLSSNQTSIKIPAKLFRVGVTNAADRGLDMWANFGLAIQIKHLSLTEELAENIVTTVTADRIVIVCKNSERNLIVSLLNQIGWKSKIQSIITEDDLILWYSKALTGKFSSLMGSKVLGHLIEQINIEFPATDNPEIKQFMESRNYGVVNDANWK